MNRLLIAATLVASTLTAGVATAQPRYNRDNRVGVVSYGRGHDRAGWTLLGEMRADRRRDHDVMPVGRHAGRFSKLMIAVEDDGVEISNIKVTFANGDVYRPGTRMIFREGARTGAIDLPGQARAIRKIEYDTRDLRRGGRALVRIFGRADFRR